MFSACALIAYSSAWPHADKDHPASKTFSDRWSYMQAKPSIGLADGLFHNANRIRQGQSLCTAMRMLYAPHGPVRSTS